MYVELTVQEPYEYFLLVSLMLLRRLLPSLRQSNSLKSFQFHSKVKWLVEISFASAMDEAFEQTELDHSATLKREAGRRSRVWKMSLLCPLVIVVMRCSEETRRGLSVFLTDVL
jgi:hypothetical protein